MLATTIIAFALCAPEIAFAQDEGWSGEASASLSNQTGTTVSFSGTVDGTIKRTWEKDEVSARVSATYGKSKREGDASSTTTQDNQGVFTEWKHLFSEHLFSNTTSELSRNSTQDRKLRFKVDVGPGVRVWQGEEPAKSHFDVSLGVGYRYEVYDGNAGVAQDDTDVDHLIDAVLGFEYKNMLFDDRIEWTHTGSALVPVNLPGAYLLRTEGIVGVPITEAWSFRLSALVEYTNQVADNTRRTRTLTTVGLGYKF